MAKVLTIFMDKTDGRIYDAGSEYLGDRVEELAEKGFVEAPAKEKPKAKTAKKK